MWILHMHVYENQVIRLSISIRRGRGRGRGFISNVAPLRVHVTSNASPELLRCVQQGNRACSILQSCHAGAAALVYPILLVTS